MNYNKLRGKMAERKVTQVKLSEELGMSVQALNAKLNGRSPFTLDEAVRMTYILDITNPCEIFFTPNVPNTQRTYSHI